MSEKGTHVRQGTVTSVELEGERIRVHLDVDGTKRSALVLQAHESQYRSKIGQFVPLVMNGTEVKLLNAD